MECFRTVPRFRVLICQPRTDGTVASFGRSAPASDQGPPRPCSLHKVRHRTAGIPPSRRDRHPRRSKTITAASPSACHPEQAVKPRAELLRPRQCKGAKARAVRRSGISLGVLLACQMGVTSSFGIKCNFHLISQRNSFIDPVSANASRFCLFGKHHAGLPQPAKLRRALRACSG